MFFNQWRAILFQFFSPNMVSMSDNFFGLSSQPRTNIHAIFSIDRNVILTGPTKIFYLLLVIKKVKIVFYILNFLQLIFFTISICLAHHFRKLRDKFGVYFWADFLVIIFKIKEINFKLIIKMIGRH